MKLSVAIGLVMSLASVTTAHAMSSAAPRQANSESSSSPIVPPKPLSGKNRAILFGGSGDVNGMKWYTGQQNTFRDDFIKIIQQLKPAGWDVHALFEGDIARCKLTGNCPANLYANWDITVLAQALGQDPAAIPRGSRGALLSELDQAIQDLSSGDQLLIYIGTHGEGVQQPNQFFWRHGIAVSTDEPGTTFNNVPGAGYVGLMYMDDPDLLSRLQKLKDAGVKMAFVDDSCFSGGSIPVLSNYGCTLTSTSSKTLDAYSGSDTLVDSFSDVIMGSSAEKSGYSLGHPGQVTMEELWMKTLVKSPTAPEFSGNLAEATAAESVRDLDYVLYHDLEYVPAQSAFNDCENCSKDSPAVLVNYGSQFLSAQVDQAHSQSYLNTLTHYWGAPSSYPLMSLAEVQQQLATLPDQWNSFKAQYDAALAQGQNAITDIKNLGAGPQWNFTGALSGYGDLFNAAVQMENGHNINTYSMGSSFWLSYVNHSMTPKDRDFQSYIQSIASNVFQDMNSISMKNNSYLASGMIDPSIQNSLYSMILQAEMDAWNSLSESDQNRMAKDVASIQASVTAQQVPVNGLVNGFTNDSIQARAYAYLIGRDQQPADANLQACASFTLSRY